MNKKDLSQNARMLALTEGIQEQSPTLFFWGIIAGYLINAVLTIVFLEPIFRPFAGQASIWIVGAGAIVFQYFRGTFVLGGMLHPTGDKKAPGIVKTVATVAFILALFELYFSVSVLQGNDFWAVFIFGSCVVSSAYTMEVFFIVRAHRTVSDEITRQADERKAQQENEKANARRRELDFTKQEERVFTIPPILGMTKNGNGAHKQ